MLVWYCSTHCLLHWVPVSHSPATQLAAEHGGVHYHAQALGFARCKGNPIEYAHFITTKPLTVRRRQYHRVSSNMCLTEPQTTQGAAGLRRTRYKGGCATHRCMSPSTAPRQSMPSSCSQRDTAGPRTRQPPRSGRMTARRWQRQQRWCVHAWWRRCRTRRGMYSSCNAHTAK